MSKISNKIIVFLSYVCIALIVLQSHTWIGHNPAYPNLTAMLKIFILFILAFQFITLAVSYKKITFKKNELFLLLLYNMAMILLCIVNDDFQDIGFVSNEIIIFDILFLYFIYCDHKEMLEIYSKIIYIICSVSIFFFLFASVLHIIKPFGLIALRWGWGNIRYINYYFLYAETQQVQSLFYTGYRNTALWVEGPMITYSVLIAVCYEVFLRKDGIRKKYLIIYIATLVTSFSTTAYILLILIAVLKYIQILKNKQILIISVLISIPIIYFLIISFLNNKLNNAVDSYNIHFDDITATFKCFCDNWLFGVGYENFRGIDSYRTVLRINAGLSSGFGAIIAYGGIVWGIWHVLPFLVSIVRFVLYPTNRNNNAFIIVTFVLLVLVVAQDTVLRCMLTVIHWKIILNLRENDENKYNYISLRI